MGVYYCKSTTSGLDCSATSHALVLRAVGGSGRTRADVQGERECDKFLRTEMAPM